MKILAIGSSHITALYDMWSATNQDRRWRDYRIDFVPLNLCGPYHHVIGEGRGLIKFTDGTLPDFEYDIVNYDVVAIIGATMGGDALFRSLIQMGCYRPLNKAMSLGLTPLQKTAGSDGKLRTKPPIVYTEEEEPLAGHRIISQEALRELFNYQISLRISLINLPKLAELCNKLFWFEGPFPKKLAIRHRWGDEYANSMQASIIRSTFDNAVEQSELPELCEFVRFPDKLCEAGLWLDPIYAKDDAPFEIHAGAAFGEFILEHIRAADSVSIGSRLATGLRSLKLS